MRLINEHLAIIDKIYDVKQGISIALDTGQITAAEYIAECRIVDKQFKEALARAEAALNQQQLLTTNDWEPVEVIEEDPYVNDDEWYKALANMIAEDTADIFEDDRVAESMDADHPDSPVTEREHTILTNRKFVRNRSVS